MNDTLNVILIHTNYFKNILISDDYRSLINLIFINKKYFKSINDVYQNYIFYKFPNLLKFDNLSFTRLGCVSWIHVYRFIFTCPLREIILRNVVVQGKIIISLNDELYLMTCCYGCQLICTNRSSPNKFSINFLKLEKELEEFLNFRQLFENDKKIINSLLSIPNETEEIVGNTIISNFLRKVCSIYNRPSTYNTISTLITNDKLRTTENLIYIIFK